jgi:ABC-type antimicrobial peptide transport system permease subunit
MACGLLTLIGKHPYFYNMAWNYLRTEMRMLRSRRIYYLVNVIGLAMGIASAVLIMLWIADELSYEKMHAKSDHIRLLYKQYRMGDELKVNSSLPFPLAGTLIDEIPEIEMAVRTVGHPAIVSRDENAYTERNICAADTNYFQMFSFDFLAGDPETALAEPYSMVMTREKADKYFGDENPLGRELMLNREQVFTVTGIIEDIDQNTYLDYDIIIPFETIHHAREEGDDWYSHYIQTFTYTPGRINGDSLNARLTRHIRKYMTEDKTVKLIAHPIRKIHLDNPETQSSRKSYLYIFGVIALLIVLIACINFTNVSTSLSVQRSKEIGIKKVNGAHRRQLIRQFMGEAFHQAFLGFIVAMMLVELIRPQFNQLTGKEISIPYLNPLFLLALAGLVGLVTLLAGSYPAIFISAFRPIDAFRGKITTGKGQAIFRTGLLVFQFTISVGLIISTLAIHEQIRYIQGKNMGFDKENLMYVSLVGDLNQKYEVFRQELISLPMISGVCRTSVLPTSCWNIIRGLEWEGKEGEETVSFAFASVDEDFFRTLDLEILEGRDFSREFATDTNKYLINQEAARIMGFDHPVGMFFLDDTSRVEIIGMFRDFNSLPLSYPIEPMLMVMWRNFYNYALIRIRPGNVMETVAQVEKIWKELVPGFPFDHSFVDERIERQYRNEYRIGKLSGVFTILAILITCIGLFAIASHSAQQRTKEIGIRKAMGASAGSVVRKFVTVYLKWVLLANAIAWPLAWWIMDSWLDHFAYRPDLGVGVFFVAGTASMAISILTITYHAWTIARSNPVNSLRYE